MILILHPDTDKNSAEYQSLMQHLDGLHDIQNLTKKLPYLNGFA